MSRSGDDLEDERRLEELWAGEFGRRYVERNLEAGTSRRPFWDDLLVKHPVDAVLEVGCNVGANLQWITPARGVKKAVGVDINETALLALRKNAPWALPVLAVARHLPFVSGEFDLVFTAGVLIHQSPEALSVVMGEIVRCSRRYVLCMEYYSEQPMTIAYRGQERALFKRDFGALYQELFPGLGLRGKGFLAQTDGWDDVTFWLLEKSP